MVQFRIEVGDAPPGDGHQQYRVFTAVADCENVAQVRAAYFAHHAHYPHLSPSTYCVEYGDRIVPYAIRRQLTDLGFPFCGVDEVEGDDEDDEVWTTPEDMAKWVVWAINQGDPALKVEIIPHVPTLQIGGIGYGLFS